MNLLESYIKDFLLKEQINTKDHKLIEDTMEELDRNLKSKTPSMSVDSLDFDYNVVQSLRDFETVKDMNTKREKPSSYANKKRFKSQSLDKFNITTASNFKMPGLGFNPLEKLNSDKTYYTQKIQELIDIYENEDPIKWKKVINTLKNCLNFKKAVEETGLKVLGAGLFRTVVTIPTLDNVVVKIGLGKKGRSDCSKEIDFSDGKTVSRLEHQKNFPTIYTRSKNKSWYAIEKATFFNEKVFKLNASDDDKAISSEIKNDISSQFPVTMSLFDNMINIFKIINPSVKTNNWDMFKNYLAVLFRKDQSYKDAHIDYINTEKYNNLNQNKNLPFDSDETVKIQSMALENIIRNIVENYSPDRIISSNLFKRKVEIFIKDVIYLFYQSKLIVYDDIKPLEDDMLNNFIDDDILQNMLKEIGDMFDQAAMTNIRDLHVGNMGFKKNDEGKWKLIFTDIDSY
jgi:hypothetical protein